MIYYKQKEDKGDCMVRQFVLRDRAGKEKLPLAKRSVGKGGGGGGGDSGEQWWKAMVGGDGGVQCSFERIESICKVPLTRPAPRS